MPAARAAGVRLLSEAVTIRVVAGDKASKNTALAALIRSRQPLLARLLRAETRGDQAGQTDILPDLAVMMLPNLRIQAQLQIGPRVAAAATQPVAAKWIDGVLYLDSEAQPVPWNAVARELAEALLPGRNVGGLALGIKEVLMAQTIRAAAAALDELGYA